MPLDTMPANSAADLFKSLADDVLGELAHIGDSLVARAKGEDLELVKRTLGRLALNQAMVISDPSNREKHARSLAAGVSTLQNVALKYQLIASKEARDFIVRLAIKVVDVGFTFVGLPGAGSAAAAIGSRDA